MALNNEAGRKSRLTLLLFSLLFLLTLSSYIVLELFQSSLKHPA